MSDPIRVLIVEDCIDTAESTAMILDVWGFETSIARRGPDALAALEESVPDVVLLDIGLEGMNGFEVAQQIRASPRFDRTMIVVMSGYTADRDREQSKLMGCQHHVGKPVNLDRLHLLLLDGLEEFRRNEASNTCAVGDGPRSGR